jgi:Family of unknown function (DUF6345)
MKQPRFAKRPVLAALLCAAAVIAGSPALALRYSTGAVAMYTNNGGAGPDLPDTIPEAADFRSWLSGAGHTLVTSWTNGNVWGADFRDGTDNDASGGSDIADLYFFTGHGSCQNPPTATSGDFIIVHGNAGTPDVTNIGNSSRWGNSPGRERFMLLDASCPMDLISISNNWFPVFRGLHVATGHSGDVNHDTLDSVGRGDDFGAALVDHGFWFWSHNAQSVGSAWMDTGLEDVQSQVCAVVIAAGNDRNDAIDRRDNEKLNDNRSAPAPNWFAWRWRCN